MKHKTATLVGTAKDSVLSFFVTKNKIRDFDKGVEKRHHAEVNHIGLEVKEEVKQNENSSGLDGNSGSALEDIKEYYVCCIDESEYVNIFSHKTAQNAGRGGL